MPRNLLIGVSLLFAAATVWAGSAGGQFVVRVTLNNQNNNICTSAYGANAGNTPVQVTCTSNVFVNIVQLTTARMLTPSTDGRFITGFGLARSILSSALNAGQIDDAVAQQDQGWNFEGSIYAGNATPEQAKQLAKRRLRNSEGMLTALNVMGDKGQPATVELLVSF